MPEEQHELRDMSFDFLSLVNAGDNPEARVVLLKSRNPETAPGTATVDDMSDKQSHVGAPPDDGAATTITKEAVAAILEQNELLKQQKALLEEQNAAIVKALEDDVDAEDDGDYDYSDDDESDEDETDEVSKAFPPKKKGKKPAAACDEPDGDEDDMAKSVDELVKNHPAFREMQARLNKAAAEAADAQAMAKAAENARLDTIFKERASHLSALDVKSETLRKAFDVLDVDTYAEIEGYLKKAAKIVEESEVFKEVGTAAGGEVPNKLEELLAKAAVPGADGMTPEQRAVAAMRQDPSLYSSLGSLNGAVR